MNIEQLKQLAKRRGFFWQSDEIYGGLSGFYVYGHLGLLLKHKWENAWRKYFLSLDENFFEIETPDIMSEDVFKASYNLDETPEALIHWIDENLPRQFSEDALARGMSYLSKSDRFLGMVKRRQNYRFWKPFVLRGSGIRPRVYVTPSPGPRSQTRGRRIEIFPVSFFGSSDAGERSVGAVSPLRSDGSSSAYLSKPSKSRGVKEIPEKSPSPFPCFNPPCFRAAYLGARS